jgi:hypothetical protein
VTKHVDRALQCGENGFALVGVVMFILVLTILGLSLFSLTGYEAQFMQQSSDRAESFQAAAGGLDRARFALAKTSKLESVTEDLPLDGVVYAVARQEAESTGTIHWDDPNAPDILIRVKAQKNGQTHFLEAKFDPSRAPSLYKRLLSLSASGMTDSSGLRVIRNDPPEPPYQESNYLSTWLYGECRQNDDNTPDMIYPFGKPPQSLTLSLVIGGVPTPQVNGYFNDHWSTATEEGFPNGPKSFNLDAVSSPDSVGFFRTTWPGGDWSFDFDYVSPHFNKWDPDITVHGTVIWLFDHGIRSEGTIHVHGSGNPNDMLILIAKPGSDPGGSGNDHRSLTGAGMALLGSITSEVPVILVSSGGVLLENRDMGFGSTYDRDDKTSTTVSCLSVFAPYARVMGTDSDAGAQPYRLSFTRNQDDPINPRIDRLSDLGLLPNTAAGLKGKLRFLAGSWREVDETSPP